MNGFVGFMNSPVGRVLRVVLGLVLIGVGLFWLSPPWGYVVAVIGLAPLALGLSGRCIFELFTRPAQHA
jgi:hypothetical protein